MRFTLSSSVLNSRLQTLSKVINSKNPLQILDCFLFECQDGELRVTASDNENTMKTTIHLDYQEGEGRFAIPNRTILDAVKELPEQPLTFNIDTNNYMVTICYQNGEYNFACQNADEYPLPVNNLDGQTVLTMKSAILSDSISRAIFATDNNEVRPVMNGIYFDLTTENLSIVATDGHKLVRNINFELRNDVPASFILPKKPATLLRNSLAKDDSEVTICFTSRNAQITFGDTTIVCILIEGRYPNYNSVIPTDNPNILTLDRHTLLSAIKRVLPFASASSQLIRFNIEIGKVEVSSEDIDFSTSAKETLICDYGGQKMSIGFRGDSLIEILNSLDSEEVSIKLADPSRAGVIVPVTQPENQEILMLVMPMLISD